MTKTDWTILFIRLVGLYLIALHLPILIAGTSASIVMLNKAGWAQVGNVQVWQGPVAALIALGIGLCLVLKARVVTKVIEKNDKG